MSPLGLAGALVPLFRELVIFASYIRGSKTFPQPLDREEEKKYLRRYQKNGDDEARKKLIKHNLRLVAHIVKKFDNTYQDRDDLISIGTIGLIKGVNTYRMDKNTRLATYAARCIENEILMFLRSAKKGSREVLLQDSIGSDREGNEITLIDILGTDPDLVSEKVELSIQQEELYEKLNELENREKKVIELRYGLLDGIQKTQREIARVLGISRSYVSRIEKKAVNKLHKAFARG